MKQKKYHYHCAFACFDCQKSFKRQVDLIKGNPNALVCPNCGGKAINFGRHFKPPKSNDNKQWQKIQFLFEHGFHFQKIPVYASNEQNIIIGSVPYPETLEQAKVFVEKYKQYAWHLDLQSNPKV